MFGKSFAPEIAAVERAATRRLGDIRRRGELELRLYPDSTATKRVKGQKPSAGWSRR